MEIDEWHPPSTARMPDGPDAFPATGVNSLAPLGSRAVARLIDSTLVSVPAFAAFAVATIATVGLEGDPEAMANDTGLTLWLTGTWFVVSVLYETVSVALWGQTLGKLALGVRVARQANGRCPLWWEAGIRIALPALVFAVPHPAAAVAVMVLYAVAVFDPMRRGVPDRAAGTVVVRSR